MIDRQLSGAVDIELPNFQQQQIINNTRNLRKQIKSSDGMRDKPSKENFFSVRQNQQLQILSQEGSPDIINIHSKDHKFETSTSSKQINSYKSQPRIGGPLSTKKKQISSFSKSFNKPINIENFLSGLSSTEKSFPRTKRPAKSGAKFNHGFTQDYKFDDKNDFPGSPPFSEEHAVTLMNQPRLTIEDFNSENVKVKSVP